MIVAGTRPEGAASFVRGLNNRFSPLLADRAPRRPVIRLDTTTQRAEMGYLKPAALAREFGRFSRGQGLLGIGRTAQEGDFLARIEEYRDARARVAELGLQIYQVNQREFNVGLIPRSRVRAEFPLHGPMEVFV